MYRDEDFETLYPRRGQPALAPRRLALVTVFQFLEHPNDQQAADAVRSRIDWKYALNLELEDPGFYFSVLTEFRGRLNRPISIVKTCYTDIPPVEGYARRIAVDYGKGFVCPVDGPKTFPVGSTMEKAVHSLPRRF